MKEVMSKKLPTRNFSEQLPMLLTNWRIDK